MTMTSWDHQKSLRLKTPTKHHWRLAVWVKSISIPYLSQFEIGSWYKGATGGFLNNWDESAISLQGESFQQGRCLLSTGHVLVDKQMVGGSDQWLAYSDPIDMPGIPHAVFFCQSDIIQAQTHNSNHENPWNHKFFKEI